MNLFAPQYGNMLLEDLYLYSVLKSHEKVANPLADLVVFSSIQSLVQSWAGEHLHEIKVSGSNAKGTVIKGATDIDYFISIKTTCLNSLSEIYSTLYKAVSGKFSNVRQQSVSIGVNINGLEIDLVPGKQQQLGSRLHSLYHRKRQSWLQTNIDQHIELVKASGYISEIRLVKIWRYCHRIDLPSFYLEMLVIESLKSDLFQSKSISARFEKTLKFIANNIQLRRVVDPSNSNNIISDDLTLHEKKTVADKAKTSLLEFNKNNSWGKVVW